jgi:hypothetical protein
LRATKLYDVCNTVDRAQWLDILVALIEYLRSGTSKVGYLDCSHERNMLHKGVEQTVNEEGRGTIDGEEQDQGSDQEEDEERENHPNVVIDDGPRVQLRRSTRKRAENIPSDSSIIIKPKSRK